MLSIAELPIEDALLRHPHFEADPYAIYSRVRAERPVRRLHVPRWGEIVVVSRYEDVENVLKDSRLAKDPRNALTSGQIVKLRRPPAFFSALTQNMLGLDDPDHARLRKLVQAVFTSRRIAGLEAQARAASAALIDRITRMQSFDLIADYALPLPVAVISDLLGVPKHDQTRFARWSHALIQIGAASPWRGMMLAPQIIAFMRYLKKLIALKRTEPADDLVTALTQISEADLGSEELMAMIAILLSAGHETTTNLIGNGMLTLMRDPSERDRLVADPALLPTAVEELLRFVSPVEMSTPRFVREPLVIADVEIPQGAQVMGAIASANRDESRFEAPEKLNLGRTPNRHLTFGDGGHYCLGAALARLEGRIALGDLLAACPRLSLHGSQKNLRWRPNLVLRGLESLPVYNGSSEPRAFRRC